MIGYCHECARQGLVYELLLAGIPYSLKDDEVSRTFEIVCDYKTFHLTFLSPTDAILTTENNRQKIQSFSKVIEIIKEHTE